MMKFRALSACFLLVPVSALALSGCVPQMVMNSMDHQHYSDYVTKTEQINYEREKSGLAPTPIMTFSQWKGTN